MPSRSARPRWRIAMQCRKLVVPSKRVDVTNVRGSVAAFRPCASSRDEAVVSRTPAPSPAPRAGLSSRPCGRRRRQSRSVSRFGTPAGRRPRRSRAARSLAAFITASAITVDQGVRIMSSPAPLDGRAVSVGGQRLGKGVGDAPGANTPCGAAFKRAPTSPRLRTRVLTPLSLLLEA